MQSQSWYLSESAKFFVEGSNPSCTFLVFFMSSSHYFPLPDKVSFSSQFFIDSFDGRSSYQSILLSGPLGSLSFSCPSDFSFSLSDDRRSLSLIVPSHFSPVLLRSFLSLFLNSLRGVSLGFSLSLSLVGVGYKASFDHLNNSLSLSVGFSHPVIIPLPPFISLSCPSPSSILASSFHLPSLSSFIHHIRLIKPSSADHYKAKGLSLLS